MTFGNLIDNSIAELNKAGINDARFDVYEVISEMLGIDYNLLEMRLDDEITGLDLDAFGDAINRMKAGEPVAYIIGSKYFYNEKYKVVPGVLIPRPDTEVLVESALKAVGCCDFPMGDVAKVISHDLETVNFADLCTGSGCIGVSVANGILSKGKSVHGTLVDISEIALNCTKENIGLTSADIKVKKADILKDDLTDIIELESLDLLLSNPPYITLEDMKQLDRSVADFEPELALYGGEDGMIFYSRLCELAKTLLKKGGCLIVEHGYDQGQKVADVMHEYGFNNVTNIRDYGSNDRCVAGWL